MPNIAWHIKERKVRAVKGKIYRWLEQKRREEQEMEEKKVNLKRDIKDVYLKRALKNLIRDLDNAKGTVESVLKLLEERKSLY